MVGGLEPERLDAPAHGDVIDGHIGRLGRAPAIVDVVGLGIDGRASFLEDDPFGVVETQEDTALTHEGHAGRRGGSLNDPTVFDHGDALRGPEQAAVLDEREGPTATSTWTTRPPSPRSGASRPSPPRW